MRTAAEKLAHEDQDGQRRREAMVAFSALVEPLVFDAMRSLEASVGRLESGHARIEAQLEASSDDLEVMIARSLRATLM